MCPTTPTVELTVGTLVPESPDGQFPELTKHVAAALVRLLADDGPYPTGLNPATGDADYPVLGHAVETDAGMAQVEVAGLGRTDVARHPAAFGRLAWLVARYLQQLPTPPVGWVRLTIDEWRDEENVAHTAVTLYPSKIVSGRAEAGKLAREYGQATYLDLATGETVPLASQLIPALAG